MRFYKSLLQCYMCKFAYGETAKIVSDLVQGEIW